MPTYTAYPAPAAAWVSLRCARLLTREREREFRERVSRERERVSREREFRERERKSDENFVVVVVFVVVSLKAVLRPRPKSVETLIYILVVFSKHLFRTRFA